jgi:hypothetical protein
LFCVLLHGSLEEHFSERTPCYLSMYSLIKLHWLIDWLKGSKWIWWNDMLYYVILVSYPVFFVHVFIIDCCSYIYAKVCSSAVVTERLYIVLKNILTLLFLMTFLSTLDFCCRLSTFCGRLSTFCCRLSTFCCRLSTFCCRLSTFYSRLLLSTLDFYSRLSTFTLDSRPLLSTLDPRLLDTLLKIYKTYKHGRLHKNGVSLSWESEKLIIAYSPYR